MNMCSSTAMKYLSGAVKVKVTNYVKKDVWVSFIKVPSVFTGWFSSWFCRFQFFNCFVFIFLFSSSLMLSCFQPMLRYFPSILISSLAARKRFGPRGALQCQADHGQVGIIIERLQLCQHVKFPSSWIIDNSSTAKSGCTKLGYHHIYEVCLTREIVGHRFARQDMVSR